MKKIQRQEYWSVIQPPSVGPTHWSDEGGDAEEGLRGALLLGRKGIEQDALAAGLQTAAGETLHDAKKDQLTRDSSPGHRARS